MTAQEDVYSLTVEKKPYSGYSMRLSEHNVKTFKKDAVRVAAGLNAARIDCELEYLVPRIGEYAANGQEKFYSVDVAVKDPRYEAVAIELEGRGSASKDDLERDEYLLSHGFVAVLHYPNSKRSEDIIADLKRDYLKDGGVR
jgi:hypothetical protein